MFLHRDNAVRPQILPFVTRVPIHTCTSLRSHEWQFKMFFSSVVSGWSQTHLHMSHPYSMPLLVPAYRHLPTCQGPKLRNPRGQFVCDLKEGTHQQYSQLSYPPIINRILDHLLDHMLENLLCAEELAAPDHTTPGRRSGPRVEKLLQTLLLYWDYLGVG